MVRVPGSNPGETILFSFFPMPIRTRYIPIYTHIYRYIQIYTDICPYIPFIPIYTPTSPYLLSIPDISPLTYLDAHCCFSRYIYPLYPATTPYFSLTLLLFFPCIVLAPVAQLVAALDWRSKGHWFEPGREHSFCFYTDFPTFLSTLSLSFLWKVSWCSWLSHHLDVVRVPGSNPGGTILFFLPWYIR